jgi:hypothetical protein
VYFKTFRPKPKIIPESFAGSGIFSIFAMKIFNLSQIMTTIELRTSIAAELDHMSVEMLESVSRYVKRLRHHSRPAKHTVQGRCTESTDAVASGLSPRVLQFQRGNPWYATDEEVDKLRQEYLTEKYK